MAFYVSDKGCCFSLQEMVTQADGNVFQGRAYQLFCVNDISHH